MYMETQFLDGGGIGNWATPKIIDQVTNFLNSTLGFDQYELKYTP